VHATMAARAEWFAHGTLLGEKFSARKKDKRCGDAARKDHGEHGVLRENSRAAHGPNDGRPTPPHVI